MSRKSIRPAKYQKPSNIPKSNAVPISGKNSLKKSASGKGLQCDHKKVDSLQTSSTGGDSHEEQ